MTSSRIAKRYAQALFELALDRNLLEDTAREMAEFKQAIVTSKELKIFISNPILTKEQKTKILNALFTGRLSVFIINFLFFLVDKNRLSLIEEICGSFNEFYLKRNNVAVVQITSAFTVEQAQIEKICQQISSKYKMTIQPEVIVNKDLIGGIKLKLEDTVYDFSFKTQLQNFHQSICHI